MKTRQRTSNTLKNLGTTRRSAFGEGSARDKRPPLRMRRWGRACGGVSPLYLRLDSRGWVWYSYENFEEGSIMSTSLAPKWARHLAMGVVRVLSFTVACAAAL